MTNICLVEINYAFINHPECSVRVCVCPTLSDSIGANTRGNLNDGHLWINRRCRSNGVQIFIVI